MATGEFVEYPWQLIIIVSVYQCCRYAYIDLYHSAVILATVHHRSGALSELVRSGANLNLQNQVRYTVTVDTALHHVLHFWLYVSGGSDSSDDLSKEWGGRGHRYSPNRRKH